MNEHLPIYNSRVIKNYVEYLRAFYPSIDADHLLHFAGMSLQEVEDPAHWFSQNQIDRFHEALTAETGNPNISREAGRFAAFSKASGPLKRYAMGFMSPSLVIMCWKRSRSSARSIASGVVPMMGTPAASRS